MKLGQYHYAIRGRYYKIYRCTYKEGNVESSTPVKDEPEYYDREEAKKRVYELNGWKYVPKA